MKKTIAFGAMAVVLTLLAACNTIEGIGQDVEAAGESVSNAARNGS
mgnify:CR=1 FL=1